MRVAADAYGATSAQRAALVDAMLERFARNRTFWSEQLALTAAADVSSARIAARIAWSASEFAFVTEQRAIFEAALR